MERITTHQAKTHFSQLVNRALEGEEIVIFRGDRPVVRLLPFEPVDSAPKRPKVGTITSGPVLLSDGVFAPMDQDELAEWGL